MSTQGELNQTDSRKEFMTGPGFVLFSDLNLQVLEHLETMPLKPINLEGYPDSNFHPEFLALLAMKSHIASMIPPHKMGGTAARARWFGMSEEERVQAGKFAFAAGTDDSAFTWEFASGLAARVVTAFENEGRLSPEQRKLMTYTDWANVIGTGWFSALTHQFAMAGNGMLGSYGRYLSAYDREDSLKGAVISATGALSTFPSGVAKARREESHGFDLLKVVEVEEPEDDHIYLVATLNHEFKEVIKEHRKDYRHFDGHGVSVGCPVARKHTTLPPDYKSRLPRAKTLESKGVLTVSDTTDKNGDFLASMSMTPIERTLAFFALQLRTYDKKYGTPRQLPSGAIKHIKSLPLNGVFFWPKEQPKAA